MSWEDDPSLRPRQALKVSKNTQVQRDNDALDILNSELKKEYQKIPKDKADTARTAANIEALEREIKAKGGQPPDVKARPVADNWENDPSLKTTKKVQRTTAKDVGRSIGDAALGSLELPLALATGTAANVAGNLSGAAYEYVANPIARLLGKKDIAKAPDVRSSIIKDYTYQPSSESGKASLQALGTLTTPVRAIGDLVSGVSEGLGGSEFTNAMIGDVAMAAVPGIAAKGVKKAASIAPNIANVVSPIKAYDTAANAVYNAQKNTSKYLKGQSANIPAGIFKNAVVGTQKMVNAVGSDAAAFGTAGGALASGNVPLAAVVLAARQLRKRGAQNFGKSQNTATSELATTIKKDIASPEVNTYNTEAIGSIGSQNIDDLVNSIKADITDTEE